MDIHKPKPWHGWREFLKEYGIIVLGVLTALGFEQVVEWAHWRHEVQVADGALRAELRQDGLQTLKVMASWPCAVRRMDRLSLDLRTAKGAWKAHGFMLLGRKAVLVTPGQPWFTSAWEEYKANGAVQHMDDAQRALFNKLYTYVAAESGWDREIGTATAELNVLADDLPPLSDVTRDRSLADLEKIRYSEFFADNVGRQFVERLRAAGVTFTDAEQHPQINACNPAYGYPG